MQTHLILALCIALLLPVQASSTPKKPPLPGLWDAIKAGKELKKVEHHLDHPHQRAKSDSDLNSQFQQHLGRRRGALAGAQDEEEDDDDWDEPVVTYGKSKSDSDLSSSKAGTGRSKEKAGGTSTQSKSSSGKADSKVPVSPPRAPPPTPQVPQTSTPPPSSPERKSLLSDIASSSPKKLRKTGVDPTGNTPPISPALSQQKNKDLESFTGSKTFETARLRHLAEDKNEDNEVWV